MAVTMQSAGRGQARLTRLIVGVSLVGAMVAVAPIVAALFGVGTPTARPSTAFASAPAGNYAVVSRNEGTVDVIGVVWAENPGAVTEIARVPHLDGFTSTGTVSPDGTRVALVTVDAGSAARPGASLIFVNLETGELYRGATNVEPMQTPVWEPDGRAAVVTRATPGGIDVVRVGLAAQETLLSSHPDVLGVYPIGHDSSGELLQVVIDSRGSTVQKSGSDFVHLGAFITRDWALSPDGSRLAYIEVNTDSGLQYLARTAALGERSTVQAQALTLDLSALGAAWNPETGDATYGAEPQEGVQIQALSSDANDPQGFDVPLAYSADGDVLAVTHWTGESFDEPGVSGVYLVDAEGRWAIGGGARFLGWSAR